MNRYFLAFLFVLVALPASAADDYWTAKRTEIMKRDLALEKMYTRYEIERQTTPPGATIPKNKSLVVPYTKSRIVDLARNAKKAAAVQLAIMAALEAAGWAIDELTKDVTEPNWLDDPYYVPDKYWSCSTCPITDSVNVTKANTPMGSCENFASAWGGTIDTNWLDGGLQKTNDTSYNCKVIKGSTVVYGPHVSNSCPAGSTDLWCLPPEQTEGTPTLVPDPLVVDQVAPYLDGLPDFSLDDIFSDERGIPIMTPELKGAINDYNQDLADADPNLSWNPATGDFTYTDPTTQDQTSWGADPAVTENTDTSASDQDPLGSEWPDFCDWTVAAGFCDIEEREQPDYQPVLVKYQDVNDSIGAADSPLPGLPDWPVGFGGGESCPGVTVSVSQIGYSQNVMSKACELAIQYVNPFFTWFFALLAAWYCWTVFHQETTRGF